MEIEIGKLYSNKTLKYLVPALNAYGEMFRTKINLVFKLAFGIHDSLLDGTHLEGQKNIYVLVDRMHRPDAYHNFATWIQNQECYVTDYAYDCQERGRLQMFVIAFPPKCADAYDKFLLGKYSKMYVKDEIESFFKIEASKAVLYKKSIAIPGFASAVKQRFGTILEEEDFKVQGIEYDLPPARAEEFFNNKSLDKVFY